MRPGEVCEDYLDPYFAECLVRSAVDGRGTGQCDYVLVFVSERIGIGAVVVRTNLVSDAWRPSMMIWPVRPVAARIATLIAAILFKALVLIAVSCSRIYRFLLGTGHDHNVFIWLLTDSKSTKSRGFDCHPPFLLHLQFHGGYPTALSACGVATDFASSLTLAMCFRAWSLVEFCPHVKPLSRHDARQVAGAQYYWEVYEICLLLITSRAKCLAEGSARQLSRWGLWLALAF